MILQRGFQESNIVIFSKIHLINMFDKLHNNYIVICQN